MQTIQSMICDDLGYCCEWYFFSRFSNTDLIAARLGVSTRAVRYHKAAPATCESRDCCMEKRTLISPKPAESATNS